MDEKNKEWKKILADFLKKLKIIGNDFTGKVDIDFNQGGVRNIIRSESL